MWTQFLDNIALVFCKQKVNGRSKLWKKPWKPKTVENSTLPSKEIIHMRNSIMTPLTGMLQGRVASCRSMGRVLAKQDVQISSFILQLRKYLADFSFVVGSCVVHVGDVVRWRLLEAFYWLVTSIENCLASILPKLPPWYSHYILEENAWRTPESYFLPPTVILLSCVSLNVLSRRDDSDISKALFRS